LYGIYYDPQKYGVDVPKREKDERYEGDTHRVEFFLGFWEYVKEHNTPIDFFTWHSYAKVEKTLFLDGYIHKKLTEYGYGDLERHMNEWNNAHENRLFGTSEASASYAEMICAMQYSHTDMLCYYDTRATAGGYSGFFAPLTYEPVCSYYVFLAFGEIFDLENQVECVFDKQEEGVYAVAGAKDGKKIMMITNHSEQTRNVTLNAGDDMKVYLIDKDNYIAPTQLCAKDFEMKPNQVVVIKNT
jgi:hypothetical protein